MSSNTSEQGAGPWSADDSDPPEHRCGFELLPRDIDGGVFDLETGDVDLGTWRKNYEPASCCRPPYENGRCRWHADVESSVIDEALAERDERTQNFDGIVVRHLRTDDRVSLAGCQLRGATFESVFLSDSDFTGATFNYSEFTNTHFTFSELSDAEFRYTAFSDSVFNCSDFSAVSFQEANFRDTSFKRGDLRDAYFGATEIDDCNFSHSDCHRSNFEGATVRNTSIRGTTMTDANLSGASFSVHTLRHVDLSGSNLRRTTFEDVDIGGVSLSGVVLDRETSFEYAEPSSPSVTKALKSVVPDIAEDEVKRGLITENREKSWDRQARAHHQFKTAFDHNGFVGRARRSHRRERRARRHETIEAEGWLSRSHLTLFTLGLFTGYGVGVFRVVGTMIALLSLGIGTYMAVGVDDPFVRSVVAFTTAASPARVTAFPLWAKLIVGAETFFGTLLIVSLGFVLGNREQF